MPWFEVEMTQVCVAVVEAATEKDAIKVAREESSMLDFEIDEMGATELLTEAQIDAAKRHANATIPAAA